MKKDRTPVGAAPTLLNGSTGDPCLFIDYPGKNDALLFDAGDNGTLSLTRLADLEAVFITHHHIDHFIGFDRILRANIDSDKSLHVYGPTGTIQKIYDRIQAYEFPFFPFQQIELVVHELVPGWIRTGTLECRRRFPEPIISERPWKGKIIHENRDLHVEAVFGDHTVPCLSFAVVERGGYHPDRSKLEAGLLRPGRWLGEVTRLLQANAPLTETLEIQGGQYPLKTLVEQYFTKITGLRIAYIVDTAWSKTVQDALIQLAFRADILYCDSFYREQHRKQAEKHRHMTTHDAADLATRAKVKQLCLIHFSQRYAGQYEELVAEVAALFPNTTAVLPTACPNELNRE